MIKNYFFAAMWLFSGSMFAQMGISTRTPKATLDITAIKPTGTATEPDGLLVPRVDRERAQSMVGVKTSTLIYVTDISTGTQADTARFIDGNGFYTYDEILAAWVKLNPAAPPTPVVPEPVATSYVLMHDTENPGQIPGYGWNEPLNSQKPSIYKDFTIPVGALTKNSGSIEFSFRVYRSQGAGVWGTRIMLSEDGGKTWPDYFNWGGSVGDIIVSGRIFFNDGKLTVLTTTGSSWSTGTVSNATKAVTFRLTANTTDLITRMTVDYARFILVK
ncbi:hypothetical protein [Flavobacterium pectinovorum]|uniref:Uncharacterized protein n=2 Tax=Flavobacterium pectinovorum TaxID=29533 RepID=A0ABY1JA14_9FLAO|nr:hypothetical protein [Flavobacterium pectinovorum]SHN21659.1 hypothetical protein SAMN05444387_4734 [Flavobacterium pectinovorum]